AMWIDENDPKHFIIGGDGGLGITYDPGVSWYFPETIPVAQFYQIAVDHERPFNVYGGMQDNGNWSGPAYTWKRGGIRTLYWQYLVGGDGFYIAPDLENPRFGYGTSQNGDLYRYDKLTGYYQSIQPPSPDLKTKLRFNWNAAFAKDPFNADALYYGSQYVHKSEDRGASWTVISPDLSTNNPEQQQRDYGGLTLDLSGAENYNSLLAIAPSRLDKQLIWAATDDGQLHLTRDGGKQWKNLTSNLKGLPEGAWIARIHPSAHEASTAWAVVKNYRKGDYSSYLFKTTNYGKSWQNVLANKAVRGYALSFIQDPVVADLQFLGTEHGLYISRDGGSHWVAFKNGFPSVSTRDLVIQEPESALVVGTFGRAIWVLDDLQSLRAIAKGGLKQPIAALPMNEVVQVKGLFINPPGNIWTGFHTTFEGENRSFQRAEIPVFISGSVTESDSISVRIKDASGRAIQNVVTKGLKPGLNYMHWKLDEQMHRLPGAGVSDESRGIAVLAGDYTAESSFKGSTVSTSISVIDDPRFAIDPSIEAALYQYQKGLDSLVSDFSNAYNSLTALETAAKKQATESQNASLQDELAELLLAGRDRPVDRQVGAWQSDKITPHSLLSDLLKLSRARTMPLSDQEYERLDSAKIEVENYVEKVTEFKRRHKNTLEALVR
ncbi:MAG: WD40/YVTN/BNR-like repeat-containing protein, partial [Flavobacteriaceae bacterium]